MKPLLVNIKGNRFPVIRDENTGQLFLYDPTNALKDFHHVALPETKLAGIEHDAGLGLTAKSLLTQIGPTALSFVPVVGPILGPIASAISSLFGGGDPTPAKSIWKNVIDLREQLAQLRNAVSGKITDTFKVPPGLDRSSDGDMPSGTALAAIITADIMGLPTSNRKKVKRDSEYAAIQAMQGMIQQLQQQLHDQQLTQNILTQAQAQQVMTPPIALSPPVPITTAPLVNAPGMPPFAPQSAALPVTRTITKTIYSGGGSIYGTPYTPPETTADVQPVTQSISLSLPQYLPWLIGGSVLLMFLMRQGEPEKQKVK